MKDKVLFQDNLDGSLEEGWAIPPDNFVDHPQYGRLYYLDWEKEESKYPTKFPCVGDETWQDYRIELEALPASQGGFLGINFHVQSDLMGACNVHFPLEASGRSEAFQTLHIWDQSCAWKLYPESQAYAIFPTGEWIPLRLDVAKTCANFYAMGVSRPLMTLFDLPYRRGGVQLFALAGSGYFRNLRITQLSPDEIVPEFDNPWRAYDNLNVIRTWQVTSPQQSDLGAAGIPEQIYSPEVEWITAQSDQRGVINLSSLFPENNTKAAVFAQATIQSSERTKRVCRLTFTDRLALWCNGVQIFEGPPKGWNDPNREKYYGGRLIPDEFEVELVLESGDNTLLLRSEVTEPWGWAFWLRVDQGMEELTGEE
jgi:hypothetical protein